MKSGICCSFPTMPCERRHAVRTTAAELPEIYHNSCMSFLIQRDQYTWRVCQYHYRYSIIISSPPILSTPSLRIMLVAFIIMLAALIIILICTTAIHLTHNFPRCCHALGSTITFIKLLVHLTLVYIDLTITRVNYHFHYYEINDHRNCYPISTSPLHYS